MEQPEVSRAGCLDMQVCIPADWSDEKATEFAEQSNPCGTSGGWAVRKQGSPYLAGCDERVACRDKPGFVHLTLDA